METRQSFSQTLIDGLGTRLLQSNVCDGVVCNVMVHDGVVCDACGM